MRIAKMDDSKLVKRITDDDDTIWRNHVNDIMRKYEIEPEQLLAEKDILKATLKEKANQLYEEEVINERLTHSKVQHWASNVKDQERGRRPSYMLNLTRKRCNAILRVRSRSLAVKTNQRSSFHGQTTCRFCRKEEETQEHILQHCEKTPEDFNRINYEDIFDSERDDMDKIADAIIKMMELLDETEARLVPAVKLKIINNQWETVIGRNRT